MAITIMVAIFLVVYAAIAFEHQLKINKSASALMGAGLLWTAYALTVGHVESHLSESVSSVAGIILFLMGAMTIVEVVDAHDGFEVIVSKIKAKKMVPLVWIVGFVTFFLSAVLDNLTTTIVMLSLVQKVLGQKEDRLFFAGIIVIAANAGGAWSPIGDVTTTMLWIGGQITAFEIMKGVFIPSIINMVVSLVVISYIFRGRAVVAPHNSSCLINKNGTNRCETTAFERNFMFFGGIGILCAVPIFKMLTHLPPFMGILFGLGILWMAGEIVHRHKEEEEKKHLTLVAALQRVDMSILLFFVGILLAVGVLEHTHILANFAVRLDEAIGSQTIIVIMIGLLSAIVDNVPIVAAAMGMYPLTKFPTDSFLWEFMAYAAGTGGSILIIGSAAGVAAMSKEKIEFFWYLKKIGPLAFAGYIAGAVAYVILH